MIILLDLDGVMISGASWKPVEIHNDRFPSFKPTAVKALNKILSKINASVILTSSHKSKYTRFEWEIIFKNRNINTSIKTLPPNTLNLNRKDEILFYLDNNDIKNYVIIDDDKSLNGLPSNIKERFILVDPLIGLNDELTDRIIEVLNK